MDDETLILASYVKISKYRVLTVKTLARMNVMIPTEIAETSGIRVNHISKVLRELKDKGIIECLNEESHKGRLYRLTSLGWDILSLI